MRVRFARAIDRIRDIGKPWRASPESNYRRNVAGVASERYAAVLADGRRPAFVFPPRDQKEPWKTDEKLLRPSKEYPSGYELVLVNLVRERVEAWRSQGYPGVTRTTLELIQWWTRDGREKRLFFAQLEAALSIVFLTEARTDFLQGIEVPRDEPSDDRKTEGYVGFLRYACKMATGGGKTTVMGMLASWSILNKVNDRSDARFSDVVLVVCPNVTIRQRLSELNPENGEASILRDSVVQLAQEDSRKAEQVHKLLKYLYPGFQRPAPNYPNIEDFLNLIEMAKLFNSEEFIKSELWPTEKLDEVQQITLKAVTDYIWKRMQETQGLGAIGSFVRDFVRADDTFITFNWDLTLERALYDDSDGMSFWYTYPPSSSEPSVTLLKPHGSIDWYEKARFPKGKIKQGLVQSLDDEVSVFTRFNFADLPKMADSAPIIVPPVSAKEFSYEVLRRTWRHVYRAVSNATELYVFGYSLPKEDQFARLVLGRALRSNRLKVEKGQKRVLHVHIVNPDEGTEITFRRLLGPNVERFVFHQATFQSFLTGWKEREG